MTNEHESLMNNQQLQATYVNDLSSLVVLYDDGVKRRRSKHWKWFKDLQPMPGIAPVEFSPYDENVWIWSDQHFGHKNIISYSGRPFENVQHMEQSMISSYREVIKDDDIVLFVGDFGFSKVEVLNEVLAQLPGHKILIAGNHDFNRKTGKLLGLHFDEIYPCLVLQGDRKQILLTHYPLLINNIPRDATNVHGHVHTNTIEGSTAHINVSVEAIDYKPVKLCELIKGRNI
jgi:calcineurin-like phosphoesterase family protein